MTITAFSLFKMLCFSRLLFAISTVHAFSASSLPLARRAVTSSTSLNVLWDPRETKDNELVEFPTKQQLSALRKEAKQRQAWKKISTFFIPDEESDGPFSESTLKSIDALLQSDEIVQIRGISKNSQKGAFQLGSRLCLELEMIHQELPVTLVSHKGHTSIIYSPTLDLDHPDKFPLRTSVGQKNTWTKRIKPPRDNRGQIIRE